MLKLLRFTPEIKLLHDASFGVPKYGISSPYGKQNSAAPGSSRH
jgi:hypothetical protein